MGLKFQRTPTISIWCWGSLGRWSGSLFLSWSCSLHWSFVHDDFLRRRRWGGRCHGRSSFHFQGGGGLLDVAGEVLTHRVKGGSVLRQGCVFITSAEVTRRFCQHVQILVQHIDVVVELECCRDAALARLDTFDQVRHGVGEVAMDGFAEIGHFPFFVVLVLPFICCQPA